jgi:hypothetical protein
MPPPPAGATDDRGISLSLMMMIHVNDDTNACMSCQLMRDVAMIEVDGARIRFVQGDAQQLPFPE